MLEVFNELCLGNLFIVTGLSVLGFTFHYLNKKRISDPCYMLMLEKEQDEIKQIKTEKLKHRLLRFPVSDDVKDIEKFITQEIKMGEYYMLQKNYEKAIEHFANGLSMMDDNYELINTLQKNMPKKIYEQILKEINKIKIMLPKMKTLIES